MNSSTRSVSPYSLAAGELHLRAHHDVEVLHGEQPGAIGRELALAVPLEQRELERQDRGGGEERQIAEAEVQDDDGDRRYVVWPLMMCPSSWASTNRTSSSLSTSSTPECMTTNGLSKPTAIAFTIGVCVT